MSFLDSIILGVVEGITEFLPISSTGHLILAGHLLGLPTNEFLKSFEIVIQLGAICAILFLYWRSFLDIGVLKRVLVAFIPTGIIGFVLYKLIKDYLLESKEILLWSFLLGGLALIALELFHREKPDAHKEVKNISYLQSFLIGVFQAAAIIPGISRSGATIIGGLLIGVSRIAIVEFSFLLAVPTVAAAAGYDLFKNGASFSQSDFGLLCVGFVVSFLVAMAAVKLFLSFVRTQTLIPFGIYRILLALAFFLLIV